MIDQAGRLRRNVTKTDLDSIPVDVDTLLSSNHGSGIWSGELILPALQAKAYTAVAVQSQEVRIVRGDSIRITFDLGGDYTGWTARFGAKSDLSEETYKISLRDAVWSDDSKGQGYIDLSTIDTNLVGRFYGEVELINGDQVLTGIKFVLKFLDDVIK